MSAHRPPSVAAPQYEEVEFVHPDGRVEILEFEAGTPEDVQVAALRQYTEQVTGERVIPPIEDFGRVTAAQGALTDLSRAQSGVRPAPPPTLGGFFEKPDEYLAHLAKRLTWDQVVEAIQDPAAYAEKIGDIAGAPSRGVQMALSGYEDLAAGDRAPLARALEAGTARAASFIPAAAGAALDFINQEVAPQIGQAPAAGVALVPELYEASMRGKEAAELVPLEGPRSVFEIDSPEAMTQWFFNTLGEQAPIVAGLVGTGTLGGPAALFPASMGLETGIITQQQLEAGKGTDPRSAVVGGALAGALEATPIMLWLRRTSLGDDAVRWVGSRLQSMVAQTAEEMPTEYAQEIVEALATQFVAGNKDQFSGREWEEALRIVKETQPEAVSAAAAAGVIGPLMGAFGGQGGVDPSMAYQEIVRQKMIEREQAAKVAQEMPVVEIPRRPGIADIIRSTLEQRPLPPPGAPGEVVGGPQIPEIEPMPPIEEGPVEEPPAPVQPKGPPPTAPPAAPAEEPAPEEPKGGPIGKTGLEAAHQFTDTGEVVTTGQIHQAPPDEDVILGFYDHETDEFLTREEALERVKLAEPVSDRAKAGEGLDAVDLTHGQVERAGEAPEERRGPDRAKIPAGLRGDEEARLKDLLRSGQAAEAEAFAGEIVRRAETDGLTGLRNQAAHDRAVGEAPEGARHVYIDLDDFKELNDTFGHEVGDTMLASVGDVLNDELADIDGMEGFRRGGDEFAILATGNQNILAGVAERIRQRISEIEIEFVDSEGRTTIGKVGASYGIGSNLEEADRALYQDKQGKAQRRAEREAPAEPAAEETRPEAEREPPSVGEEGEERGPEREVPSEEVKPPKPPAELPEPIAEPSEEDIARLARLWQSAIVDNPVDVLRDEDEREGFVQEIIDTLADPDDTRTEELGRYLSERPEREIIQIAKDAYEGKEARANLPLPFSERVKEKARKKREGAAAEMTGQAFVSRIQGAKTLEDLDKIMDQAREAGVAEQKQVEIAYERREDKLLYDLEPNLSARMNLKRMRHDKPPMKAHPDSRAVEEAKTPEGMRRQLSPLGGALNVITGDLERFERELGELEGAESSEIDALLGRFNKWWQGIPEGDAKEAASNRWAELYHQILKAKSAAEVAEAPETAPEPEAPTTPEITEAEEPAPAAATEAPSGRHAQDIELLGKLDEVLALEGGISSDRLFELADEVYGGTRAEGAYQESDVYDVLEAAFNEDKGIIDNVTGTVERVRQVVTHLDGMTKKLPKQPARTEQRQDLQQFSTPPSYAAIVAWLANIGATDVVVEPSAGTGNLTTQAANYEPARVVGNEIDPRRANLLRHHPDVDHVYEYDADHLHAFLSDKETPTVIVMNPPFSRDVKRRGRRQIHVGMRHVVQAVRLVRPGGRVVAIVGGGLGNAGPEGGASLTTPSYKKDFKAIEEASGYIRANIRVPGSVYATHGTAFHTRILVIDKLPEGERVLIGKTPITGEVATLEELTDILSEVRNERQHPTSVPKQPAREGGGEGAEEVGAAEAEEPIGAPGAAAVPPGRVAGTATGEEGPAAGVPPATRGEEPGRGVQRPATGAETPVGGPAVEEGAGEGESGRGGRAPGRAAPRRPSEPGQRVSERGPDALRVDRVEKTQDPKEQQEGDIFSRYQPTLAVGDSKPHPTPLSESLIMGSIDLPEVEVALAIPKKVIKSGVISDAQLEAIAYAAAAHGEMLPDGETRKGYFVGDGTGVGKTRIIGGVILDNWEQGRKKALVLSPDKKLWEDFREELGAMGFPLKSMFQLPKVGEEIKRDEGILYVTYATLVGVRQGEGDEADVTRLQQILDWLGDDFDGVIAFDEAHLMGNSMVEQLAIGRKQPSKRALAGWKLQNAVPAARVLYASATGATEIRNLAFAARLGLWGQGTPFASREEFVNEMTRGGLSAMELVAQDMKRLGIYIARNLVLDVEYERLTHELTPEQLAIYDKVAEAWQIIYQNVDEALVATGQVTEDEVGNRSWSNAARNAMSRFYGDQQRFFNTLLASLKMPTVLAALEADVKAGHAPVIQIKSTGEAALDRALAQHLSQDEIQDLEVDSLGVMLHYLESAFPVKKYEEYEDEEGNVQTREVLDPETGKPVLDPRAIELRDRMLEQMGGIKLPELPLDQIINHFGVTNVAEVTGRSKRRIYDSSKKRWFIEKRTQRHATADRKAFMDGRKQILVFSMDAGGTGHSYHASMDAKNQKLRRHYVLEGGWRADQAIQALGRTHRAGQAQPPVWILTETNLAGEKRFVSTVARRLQQLGALTKGSREASGQELYSEMDNLETEWAGPALAAFFRSVAAGRFEMDLGDFVRKTGLNLLNLQGGLRSEGSMPNVPKFLNRVLALPIDEQFQVFNGFLSHYEMAVADAKRSGQYDVGTETVKHDGARAAHEETVYSEGAAQTRYVQVELKKANHPVPFDRVRDFAVGLRGGPQFYTNTRSGKVYAIVGLREGTERSTGNVIHQYYLMRPDGTTFLRPQNDLYGKNWEELTGEKARTAWQKGFDEVPEFRTENLHMFTGALIPVWDRFPEHASVEIRRVVLDDGRVLLGRTHREDSLKGTLERFGASKKKLELAPEELLERVMQDNYAVTLANDWKFVRRTVHGEERLELIGPDYAWHDQLRNMGVLLERPTGYTTRYFIPIDKTKGPEVIKKVLAGQTIMDIDSPTERGISDEDAEFHDYTPEYMALPDPIAGLIDKLSQPFRARRPPDLDPVFIPPELRHSVPAVEQRKAEARRGAIEETTREKASKAAGELKRSFKSTFEYLSPQESATMALTVDILRQYKAAPQFGRAVAYDTIRDITEGLDAERLVLFTDYLALGDIIKDVEAGLYDDRAELPFGYSHQRLGSRYDEARDIERDFQRVARIVEANPEVQRAIEKRQAFQRALTRKLVQLQILPPEVLADPRYYHRQVLDHLNARTNFPLGATAGADVHIRKKSFQRRRAGGSDFNLAYHEAEFEYLAQAMAQIAKVETLERLKQIHDMVPQLKRDAKRRNELAAEAIWARQLNVSLEEALAHWDAEPTTHPTWYYRSRIALANQRLGALAAQNSLSVPGWDHLIEELGDSYLAWQEGADAGLEGQFHFDHPDWFRFLSQLAAQPDPDIEENPGPIQALSIFKNIREKEQFIKGTLGRKYATWRTMAKDVPGFTTWQPVEGRHFFFGHTISDKVLDQVLAGEKLLREDDVRDMLIVGGPRETWVIPEGLAATLNDWGPRDEGRIEDAARWALSSWKQWVLLNPLRAVRYNFNNMSGDLDIVLAYDPRILKEFDKAARDLWAHQVKGDASRAVTKELQDAIRRGVVDSGLTIYEIPDIKKTGAFRALVATKNPNAFQKAAEGYWHGVRNLTTWRENILRLAAYRYFQKRIAAGDTVYGASNKMQIDAIDDVEDKAAKLARELVGDYGNISAAGQWLRSHLLPFYSWLEINAPRYVRLMRNLPHEGRAGARARGAGVAGAATARKALIFAFKVQLLYGAVALWNRLMWPDEDRELNKNRRQLHLILGRRKDGSIISIRFEGALSDALEWFGLDDYPKEIRDVAAGKKDVWDVLSEAGKAPINRLIQSWEPFSKTTFELVLGRGSFPSFFEEGKSWKPRTRPIRNRLEHLARTVSMDWLVRKVSRGTSKPLPKRPSAEIPGLPPHVGMVLDALLFYRTDPGEAAYWHARDLVVKWQKKHGDEMPSITPTERGNALYYHRKALAWGDEKAAAAWLKEYVKLGGTADGYKLSIERAHPLGALSKKKQAAFFSSLTEEERDEIKAGIAWYQSVYGGNGGN